MNNYNEFRYPSKLKEVMNIAIQDSFKAMSDPVRREILVLLKGGKMSAGDIASRFTLTHATVSHHLNQLKKADLIFETKAKNFVFYELNTTVLDDLLFWISQFKKTEVSAEDEISTLEELQ